MLVKRRLRKCWCIKLGDVLRQSMLGIDERICYQEEGETKAVNMGDSAVLLSAQQTAWPAGDEH